MPELITTLGTYGRDELGLVLPHEHVFVDLGPRGRTLEGRRSRRRGEDSPCGRPRGRPDRALIGSYTLHADVVHRQLDVLEDAGYTADRFVWIHAQAEGIEDHEAVAERGAFVEYDRIGGDDQDDERYVDLIEQMLDAGYEDQLLLSQDRGWYEPSEPEGGAVKPYTYLVDTFLPTLRAAGIDESTIRQLTEDNPFDAYAR